MDSTRFRLGAFYLLVGLLVFSPRNVLALDTSTATVQESSATLDIPEQDPTTSSQETESKGILPMDGDTVYSSGTLMPNSIFTEKTPYDQGRAELIRAINLWAAGHPEAASDTALEAYDDLIELRRVPGVKRALIRTYVRQAAEVYVEAGIAYIRSFVRKAGYTPEAIEEGRGCLEDLRDVAHNYKDLNKMLNTAIEQLSDPSIPSPQPPTSPIVELSTAIPASMSPPPRPARKSSSTAHKRKKQPSK